jgi:phthiodiolone/phenolphthiodiolone dimycocerosates ketoreductase
MLSIGAPAAVHPSGDPLGDVRWADTVAGIEAVWFIDHLQGWFPRGIDSGTVGDPHALLDPFAVMGAGAAQTKRVSIGVSVTDPIRRAPAVLLQSALTIGWLGGRPMMLGLGSGAAENLQPFGLDRPQKTAILGAACETFVSMREERGASKAPLWVAAHGPKTFAIAGRYADGWLPTLVSPRTYGTMLRTLREQAEANGRDPGSIRPAMFTWAALAPTHEASLALLEAPLVKSVALFRNQAAFTRRGAKHPLGQEDAPHYIPGDIAESEAARIVAQIPAAVAADSMLCGSLDEVRARLDQYEEAGCEHVIVWDIGRYAGPDGLARSRECLGALVESRPQQ